MRTQRQFNAWRRLSATLYLSAAVTLIGLPGRTVRADCWYLDHQWPTSGKPVGVAVDSSGNVYATCHETACGIQKYNSAGRLLAEWGPHGRGAGEVVTPYGIAVDAAGCVYVADTGNRRIQKFRRDGVLLRQWSRFARGRTRTFRPFGVATEPGGQYVYVSDDANSRVLKFTSQGFPVREWGGYGPADEQLMTPRHIATDNAGFLYVADSSANCVKKFTPLGAVEHVWGGPGNHATLFASPIGVAVDNLAYLWVTDGSHRVQQFRQGARREGWFGGCDDPDHAKTGCWHDLTESHHPVPGSGGGQFHQPFGVAVDLAGNLYVADYANHRIQKLTSLETAALPDSQAPATETHSISACAALHATSRTGDP